jgi:ABC-type Na+ efflux pump permease subunit
MFELIGFLGALIVLLGYFLLATEKIQVGKIFHLINFAGAICLGLSVLVKGAWSALFLQVVFGFVAVAAIFKRK